MELKSDANGLFIEGMTDSVELAAYLQRKFKEEDIQNTYKSLTEDHINVARSQDITPLRNFWQRLNQTAVIGRLKIWCVAAKSLQSSRKTPMGFM